MIRTMIGNEEFFIKGEKAQWTIGKVSVAKTGKNAGEEVFTGEWFYTSLEGMLKQLLERKVRCAEANTMQELRGVIRDAKDEIMGAFDLDVVG